LCVVAYPDGHGKHAPSVPIDAHIFSEHVKHTDLFAAANVPLGQLVHAVFSDIDAVPFGQIAHKCERLEVDK
jgi:hypothetical protein